MNTTTPKTTWSNIAGTAVNTNPVILDAAGRALVFGDGDYRLVLNDAAGNLIWDQSASTVVSAAMYPVVSAPTIAAAQGLLGIDATAAADIAAETAARIAADNAEATARANADTAEANARSAADTTLTNNLNAEVTNRTNADTNLQNQINTITGGASTAGIRAGTVTTSGGSFTLTFTPPFAHGVAQIWVGYPPGVGEPTSGSPANPVSFPHITSSSVSGAVGLLTDNNFTPISGSMNWWAIGWVIALALFSGWT
jgi:hypothetical protein